MEFRTTVTLGGKTATGLQVPDEVVTALGAGKRPPVVVAVGGHTYRTTIAPMGGAFWIPLAAEHREAAGLTAGDEVAVVVEHDPAPRERLLVGAQGPLPAGATGEEVPVHRVQDAPGHRRQRPANSASGATCTSGRSHRFSRFSARWWTATTSPP